MPLGTLDRSPPPFFKQGPSALSKLIVFSAIALFLMVADLRFRLTQPVRAAVATLLYPVQWLVLQPVALAGAAGGYVSSLHSAQQAEADAARRLAEQAGRSLQVDQLLDENQRLRELLSMRERVGSQAIGAQVAYDAADPYSRRVIIDRGQTHGVKAGAPVIDESGVLGQVTRVYPLIAEVSLLVDRDQAIPVLDVRSGVRSVAYGQPSSSGDGLELRYTLAETDVREGDLLTTSGVDAVYPPGLPVARVVAVERQSGTPFMRIRAQALARMDGALHVLVLEPTGTLPVEPPPSAQAEPAARPRAPGVGQATRRSAR